MGDMISIDATELEALRVLARKALSSSEVISGPTPPVQAPDAYDHTSDDPGTLQRGVDVQVDHPHPDWYLLSLNSRSMMCRLAAAYPTWIAPGSLLSRFRKTEMHPDLEDSVPDPSTHVCHVRTTLGRDAIETVYETRVNARGARVRTGRALGYRLGRRYAEELGFE